MSREVMQAQEEIVLKTIDNKTLQISNYLQYYYQMSLIMHRKKFEMGYREERVEIFMRSNSEIWSESVCCGLYDG